MITDSSTYSTTVSVRNDALFTTCITDIRDNIGTHSHMACLILSEIGGGCFNVVFRDIPTKVKHSFNLLKVTEMILERGWELRTLKIRWYKSLLYIYLIDMCWLCSALFYITRGILVSVLFRVPEDEPNTKIKCFPSRPAVVFAHYIESKC